MFVPGRLCLFGEHSDWVGGYRREISSLPPGHSAKLMSIRHQAIYSEKS